MKIEVKLHPSSSQERILKINDSKYEVWLKEKPIENKANIALEKFLKRYFNKPVKLVKGFKSKEKIIELR